MLQSFEYIQHGYIIPGAYEHGKVALQCSYAPDYTNIPLVVQELGRLYAGHKLF